MGTAPTYPMSINGIMLAGITLVTESATFDPTHAVKRWVDASKGGLPPGDPANYMVFDPVSGTEAPLKITNGVAATANVPAIYAPYTPTPATTPATLTCIGNPALVLPVPATSLSTLDQANALAAEIGPAIGLRLQVTIWNQAGWTFNANGETREQFMVFAGSVSGYVGYLLAAKSANGVGAPGSWSDPIGSIVKTRARSKPRRARRRTPAYQRQANPPATCRPPQPSRPSADATPAARASPAQRPPRSPRRTRAAARSRCRTATPGKRTPCASVAEAQPASRRPEGA